MTSNNRSIFLVTLLASISLIGTAKAAELPFDVFTAQYQTYPTYQSFDATIEAIRRATISSETSGR